MTFGEKRKTVVFNLDNPEERAMYEMIEKTNFSRLIKSFLSSQLKRTSQPIKTHQSTSHQ